MKVEQDERCGELLHGDATQKDVDEYDDFSVIISLTPEERKELLKMWKEVHK